MLLRDVGFGAMGGDADRAHAKVIGMLQVMDGADAGQQQSGEFGVLDDAGHRFDPVPIGMRTETVIETGAFQAVAMRYLDRVDLRVIQRLGDLADMIQAVLMADGVHAVTQGDVLNVEFLHRGIERHYAGSFAR